MKKIFVFFLFFVFCNVFAEIKQTSKYLSVNGYAAKVNENIITYQDIKKIINPLVVDIYQKYDDHEADQQLEILIENTLDQLIQKELIFAAFEAQGGQIPNEYINNKINDIIQQRFNGNDVEFENNLILEKITYDEFFNKIKKEIAISLMTSQTIDQRIQITPLEIKNYYDKNIEEYYSPEKVKYSVIKIYKGNTQIEKTNNYCKATNAFERIEKNEAFSDIAKELSDGKNAKQGGFFSWTQVKDIPTEFKPIIKNLKKGQNSPIITIGDSIIILKLNDRIRANYIPYEEVKDIIRKELRNLRRIELYNRWIARLSEENYIKKY